MIEILRGALYYIAGGMAVVILVVLLREAWRLFKKKSIKSKEERCFDLISRVHHLTPEGLMIVALELRASYPMEVIEAVLDRFAIQDTSNERRNISNLYDHLGIIEAHCRKLKEAKSWPDRAAAAEKLGFLGHPSAVLPLIATLRDQQEDLEVKNVAMRSLGKIRDERAIAPLVEALGSPDPTTCQPLADVLAQFGSEAFPALNEVLKNSSSESKRVWAVRILGRMEIPKSVPTLLNTLSDPSEKVREAATVSLGRLKDRRAVRPLNELLLHDPSPIVRESSAEALGQIGDEKALEFLKRALGDMEYGARHRAMEALEGMGEKVFPIFIEALKGGDPEARTQAAAALERLGFMERSIEELKDPEKSEAAAQLLFLAAQAGVGETLIRSMNHADFSIRTRLCQILGESRYSYALDTLLETAQKDPEWPVRLRALEGLVALGEEKALPVILQALKKEEEETRGTILSALLKLPQKLLEAILTDIFPFLHDANLEVRLAAARLLGATRSEQAVLPLLASLRDPYEPVRTIAAESLGNLAAAMDSKAGTASQGRRESVIDALLNALKDTNEKVRLKAVGSLSLLKENRTIAALARAFEWAGEDSRDLIAMAISSIPSKEIFLVIDELMGLDHPKARAGVAWTLGLLPDEKALQLATFFLGDQESIVRSAAAGAIGSYFERRAAGDDLRTRMFSQISAYLEDPNERVRAAVCNALMKMDEPSAVGALQRLLGKEPDRFVQQRIAVALGCLAEPGTGNKTIASLASVREWLDRVNDDLSKIAGTLSKTLLQSEEGFQEGILLLHSHSKTKVLKALLKSVPKKCEERFFKILSFERDLFWQEEIGEKEIVRHYEALLATSRDSRERKRALAALGKLKSPTAIPAIEASLGEDPEPGVRAQALNILLGRLQGAALLEKILLGIQDPADEVRKEIIPMLLKIPPQTLKGNREKLIPLLDSPLGEIRENASLLLAHLFRDDWRTLADHLMAASRKSRILGLIETLGRIGDPASANLFSQFLQNREAEIREAAVHWAQEAGFLSEEVLRDLLEDPQEAIRASAIRGLTKHLKPDFAPLLSLRLQDPSAKVRSELASALGKPRLAGDEQSLPILEQLTRDLNPQVRIQALVSLFRLGVIGAAEKTLPLLADLESVEREAFIKRLDREGILLDLASKLEHERKAEVRKESLKLLAALDLDRSKRTIAASLQDPSSEVRLAAVEVLGQIEDQEIQQALDSLIQDPIEAVRNAVKRRCLRKIK